MSVGEGVELEMDTSSDHHSQSRPLTFKSSANHIPISRHGMGEYFDFVLTLHSEDPSHGSPVLFVLAVCEHCGSIGIRDAFYSKTKQYCSMACSRAVQTNVPPSSQGGALVGVGDKRGCSVTVRIFPHCSSRWHSPLPNHGIPFARS